MSMVGTIVTDTPKNNPAKKKDKIQLVIITEPSILIRV